MIRPIAWEPAFRNLRGGRRPLTLRDLTAALRRRRLALLHALAQRRAQEREAPEPLRGLHDYFEHRIYKLRVSLAAPAHGRLVREGSRGLQTALHSHQTELVRELV